MTQYGLKKEMGGVWFSTFSVSLEFPLVTLSREINTWTAESKVGGAYSAGRPSMTRGKGGKSGQKAVTVRKQVFDLTE